MIEYLDTGSQLLILVTGVLSIYLVGSPNAETRLKAGIIGLIGEPGWFITAFLNEQLGIMILAFIYSYNWGRVVYNNWELIRD